MDKPKINLRAWEPIEKRKKKNEAKKNSSYLQHFEKSSSLNDEKSFTNGNPNNNKIDKKLEAHQVEHSIKSKNNAPNYYEYRFSKYPEDEPRYNIEIDRGQISKKHKKSKNKKSLSGFNLKNSPNIAKFILASIGAIMTGMIFGYLLLNYFVQPIFYEESSNYDSPNNSTSLINNNDNNQPSVSQRIYPSQSVYLLQAGVFSEMSGAEAIVAEQKALGRAAVITGEGPYHVYVGIGMAKEDAVQIKGLLDQGSDFYVKEYPIADYKFDGSDQAFTVVNSLLTAGDQLSAYLSQATSIALTSPSYVFNYDEIQRLHQQLLIESQNVKLQLSESYFNQKELIEDLTVELNYAVTAINAYKKSPNTQYLWSIQENLINYKLKYEELTKI